jgi:hypothetical protein
MSDTNQFCEECTEICMAIIPVNADSPAPPTNSRNLELSLHRASVLANQRLHENTTLEHLCWR